MAQSVEDLLEHLNIQTELQNLEWQKEFEKQDARHVEALGKAVVDSRADDARDKFSQKQQGQEVQLTKRDQYLTGKLVDSTDATLDKQGELVEHGKPFFDPTSHVMTQDDAEKIKDSAPTRDQMTDLILQGKRVKETSEEKKKREEEKAAADDIKAGESEKRTSLAATFKLHKANFDRAINQHADFSNFTGAIKTDFALVFGSLGALTRLPGIQTILTGSRVIAANALKFFTGALMPWGWKMLKAIKDGSIWGGGKFDKYLKGNVTWQKFQEKMGKKFGKESAYSGFMQRVGMKTGILERDEEKSKMMHPVLKQTGLGRTLSRMMGPFMKILKFLNPFRKWVMVAVLAVGGLLALFKGTDGKGLFAKLGNIWDMIKTFFTDTIMPALKFLWEKVLIPIKNVFMGDILPLLQGIFTNIVVPLWKNVIIPLGKVLFWIADKIFSIFTWIYDKIFKPLMRLFGLMGTTKVDEMTPAQLKAEKDYLGRGGGSWKRGLTDEEYRRKLEVNSRLEETQNDSGQIISIGASSRGDFDFSGGIQKLSGGGSGKALLAQNTTNVFSGPRNFVSRTGTELMGGSQYQGAAVVTGS